MRGVALTLVLSLLATVPVAHAGCIGCAGRSVPFSDHLGKTIVGQLASDDLDQGDVALLLQTALDGIAAIRRLGCRPL